MKKVIVQLLEDAQVFSGHQMYSVMSLQVQDDGSITHGERHHDIVRQVEEQSDCIRFLLENQRSDESKWFTTSREEWQRLHDAPDWQHISWLPFITYERTTPRGKATLTHREDPLLRTRPDLISSEFWQARLYLAKGIVTTFTEFSCLAGRDNAFCSASEWTAQVEHSKYNPACTISALAKEPQRNFRVTEGIAHPQSTWRVCSTHEISRIVAQYEQLNGHSTILVRDLQTLKALLPNTKVAGEHSPTGLPLH